MHRLSAKNIKFQQNFGVAQIVVRKLTCKQKKQYPLFSYITSYNSILCFHTLFPLVYVRFQAAPALIHMA